MIRAQDLVLITVSHNVSFTGKTWLLLMLGFRSLLVLLAGFSLFSDEQERFVCNTIQPGCSNLCFNVFCPVSILRLWLFHLTLLLLPHLLFTSYVSHRVLSGAALEPPHSDRSSPLTLQKCGVPEPSSPRFHGAYISVVLLRMLLEAGFGAGQFFLFGLSFPKSFLCYEAPCTSGIECYVSRPTEKSLMLNFMLAFAAASVLLSLADLVGSVKALLRRRRRKRHSFLEEASKGERGSVFTSSEDSEQLLTKRSSPSANAALANAALANAALANAALANGEPHFAKAEQPRPPTPSHFLQQNQLKPPLKPRPERGAAAPPRAPTPSVCRRSAAAAGNAGGQSDSSDSQDHRRAWV